MKKRVVLFLMVLASVSMLISSFAHAQASDSDAICGTSTQQANALEGMIAQDEALLKISRKDSDIVAVKAKLAEERKELADVTKDLNAYCN